MSGKPPIRGRAARLARLLPTGSSGAARTPFVLLVVVLLGGGLIVLLMLNSSLNEGSFRLSKLKKETTELTDRQQELRREVDAYSAPGELERRARELGLVPGGNPVFLNPDGRVRGKPAESSLLGAPPPAGSATSMTTASATDSAEQTAEPTAALAHGAADPGRSVTLTRPTTSAHGRTAPSGPAAAPPTSGR
ncbi:septum formation initiator [Streptomyces sp. NPDC002851]